MSPESTRVEDQAAIAQGGVGRTVAAGLMWTAAAQLLTHLVLVAKLVVLARLLRPADFGTIAVALAVVAVVEGLTLLGSDTALVQQRGSIERYLDSAWTLNLLRGVLLAAIVFASANLVGAFFGDERVSFALRWLALTFAVRGFENTRTAHLLRELRYLRHVLPRITEVLGDAAGSILYAIFVGRDFNALVFGAVTGSVLRVGASYLVLPALPRLDFDRRAARTILGFGKWFWASSVAVLLSTKVDILIVGRLLGAAPVGFYQMATKVSAYTTREVSEVVSKVAFPAYARIQGDTNRLKSRYLRSVKLMAILVAPLALIVLAFTEEIIGLSLGQKWLPTVPVVRLLVVAGCFRSLAGMAGWLSYAVGQPRLNFLMNTLRGATMVAAVLPMSLVWGLEGAGWGVLLSAVATMPLVHVIGARTANVPIEDYLRTLFVPVGAAFALVGSLMLLAGVTEGPADPSFILTAVVLGASYLLLWARAEAGLVRSLFSRTR